jgi:hypothetical protein
VSKLDRYETSALNILSDQDCDVGTEDENVVPVFGALNQLNELIEKGTNK